MKIQTSRIIRNNAVMAAIARSLFALLFMVLLAGAFSFAAKAETTSNWSSCQGVTESVYISVYSPSSGTLCTSNGSFTLPGSESDVFDVTIHGLDSLGASGDDWAKTYVYRKQGFIMEIDEAAEESYTFEGVPAEEPIYVGAYVGNPWGGIYIREYDQIAPYPVTEGSDNRNTLLLGEPSSAGGIKYYDLTLSKYVEGAGSYSVQLLDAAGNLLSGGGVSDTYQADQSGNLFIPRVPVPKDGFVYAVITKQQQQQKPIINVAAIGYLESGKKLFKVSFINNEISQLITVEPGSVMDEQAEFLFRYKNHLFFIDGEEDHSEVREQLFRIKVQEMDGGAIVGEGESYWFPLVYMLRDFWEGPFIELHSDLMNFNKIRFVPKSHEGELITGDLSGIRLYEVSSGQLYSRYSMTNEDGIALVPSESGRLVTWPYAPYSMELGVWPYDPFGMGDYTPRYTPIGELGELQNGSMGLTVVPLKRPSATPEEEEFNLQDFVWFAANMKDKGYNLDGDPDSFLDGNDLIPLMKLLAPWERLGDSYFYPVE